MVGSRECSSEGAAAAQGDQTDGDGTTTGNDADDDTTSLLAMVRHVDPGHGNKHGTILQKLSSIRYLNVDLGYGNPLKNCPSLDQIMKGIRHECGTVSRKLPGLCHLA